MWRVAIFVQQVHSKCAVLHSMIAFFRSLQNAQHCLHSLLPPTKSLYHDLRPKEHNYYQIPNYSTELHKRSFIPHSLFQYYLLQLYYHFLKIIFVCFVSVFCVPFLYTTASNHCPLSLLAQAYTFVTCSERDLVFNPAKFSVVRVNSANPNTSRKIFFIHLKIKKKSAGIFWCVSCRR